MAKLKRGAKSQAVRDQLAATPGAATKDIIAALTAKGIKVSGQIGKQVVDQVVESDHT